MTDQHPTGIRSVSTQQQPVGVPVYLAVVAGLLVLLGLMVAAPSGLVSAVVVIDALEVTLRVQAVPLLGLAAALLGAALAAAAIVGSLPQNRASGPKRRAIGTAARASVLVAGFSSAAVSLQGAVLFRHFIEGLQVEASALSPERAHDLWESLLFALLGMALLGISVAIERAIVIWLESDARVAAERRIELEHRVRVDQRQLRRAAAAIARVGGRDRALEHAVVWSIASVAIATAAAVGALAITADDFVFAESGVLMIMAALQTALTAAGRVQLMAARVRGPGFHIIGDRAEDRSRLHRIGLDIRLAGLVGAVLVVPALFTVLVLTSPALDAKRLVAVGLALLVPTLAAWLPGRWSWVRVALVHEERAAQQRLEHDRRALAAWDQGRSRIRRLLRAMRGD